MNNIPKKINPTLAQQVIFEIRFNSDFALEEIFAATTKEFKKSFPNIIHLPVLNVPFEIRNADPNFNYQPHYQLTNNTGLIIQVAPMGLSLVHTNYIEWNDFKESIKTLLKNLEPLLKQVVIVRHSLRYINKIDDLNILKLINLDISINNGDIEFDKFLVRASNKIGDINYTINISNEANFGNNATSSVVDIDVIRICDRDSFFDDEMLHIEKLHEFVKDTFFSLLKKEYLDSLNPEY